MFFPLFKLVVIQEQRTGCRKPVRFQKKKPLAESIVLSSRSSELVFSRVFMGGQHSGGATEKKTSGFALSVKHGC
jgi:hypothetical protein